MSKWDVIYRCGLCQEYENVTNPKEASKEDEARVKLLYDDHQIQKTYTKNRMNLAVKNAAANNSKNIYIIHIDLQKILVTLKVFVSNTYYISKVSLYNLTIFYYVSHNAFCYVWNETVAQRR